MMWPITGKSPTKINCHCDSQVLVQSLSLQSTFCILSSQASKEKKYEYGSTSEILNFKNYIFLKKQVKDEL